MSDTTPLLLLPYLLASQAQKHVTHNAALAMLDALAQIAVADRDLAAPPAAPAEGDRYIVASGATGAWTGKTHQIAAWQDGTWAFYPPREGWTVWVADEAVLVAWRAGSATWAAVAPTSVNPVALVGINATADATNKLAVKANAVLFSHDDVTPGTGDMRQTLNKSAAARTASLLFQNGFSGRAEIGLTGDDKLHVKVSSNGASWQESLVVDPATGNAGIGTASPACRLDVAGPARVGQYAKTALPSAAASGAGAMVYVSDESGGAVVAFSDGTAWRRVTDRAVVS